MEGQDSAPPVPSAAVDTAPQPPSTVAEVHNEAVAEDQPTNRWPITSIPQYSAHLLVGALRITEVTPGDTPEAAAKIKYEPDGYNYLQPSAHVMLDNPEPGDYLVLYPEGNMVFVPAEAFKDHYSPAAAFPDTHVAEPATDRRWNIKDGQTVIDKHTGLTLRFGSYGDASNAVFLQVATADRVIPSSDPDVEGITIKGQGCTIVFQRNGEVLRVLPHKMADDVALEERQPEPPAEPFQPNPGVRSIGATAGPAAALPANPVPPVADPQPVGMAPAMKPSAAP